MKKMIFLILVLALALSLAGCSKNDVARKIVDRVEKIKTLKVEVISTKISAKTSGTGEIANYTMYCVIKRPDKMYERQGNTVKIINGSREYIYRNNYWISTNVRFSEKKQSLYTRILELLKNATYAGVSGNCYILKVKSGNKSGNSGNKTVEIYVDKNLEFPVKVLIYSNGKLIQRVEYRDVRINVPVNDSLFYPSGKVIPAEELITVQIENNTLYSRIVSNVTATNLTKYAKFRLPLPEVRIENASLIVNENIRDHTESISDCFFATLLTGNLKVHLSEFANSYSVNYTRKGVKSVVYRGYRIYCIRNGVNQTQLSINLKRNGTLLVILTSKDMSMKELLNLTREVVNSYENASKANKAPAIPRLKVSIFVRKIKSFNVLKSELSKTLENITGFRPYIPKGDIRYAYILKSTSCVNGQCRKSSELELEYWFRNSTVYVVERRASENISTCTSCYLHFNKSVSFRRGNLLITVYCRNESVLKEFLSALS